MVDRIRPGGPDGLSGVRPFDVDGHAAETVARRRTRARRMTAPSRFAAAGVYAAIMFLVAFDATAVGASLPAIGVALGGSWEAAGFAQACYLGAVSLWMPLAGWLGDRFGLRRALTAAFGLFVVGALLCATAERFAWFVAFRVVQGAGAGLSVPLAMAVLFRTYPLEQRVSLLRVLTVPVAAAPAAGPLVGGMLTDVLSWKAVFLCQLPIGLAVLWTVKSRIPAFVGKTVAPFDGVGFGMSAAAFAGLVYASTRGPAIGWGAPDVVVAGVAGIGLLAGFIVLQRKRRHPLLNVGLFRERTFRTSGYISAFGSAGLFGMLYAVTLAYHAVSGGSALQAGSVVFWEAIGLMVASQLLPHAYRRFGARALTASALVAAAAVLLAAAWAGVGEKPWRDRLAMFAVGVALGHAAGATQLVGFSRVAPAETGQAATLYQMQSRLGAAFGVAAVSWLIGFSAGRHPAIWGRWALLIVAVFWLIAAVLALAARVSTGKPEGVTSAAGAPDDR